MRDSGNMEKLMVRGRSYSQMALRKEESFRMIRLVSGSIDF